MSKNTIIIIGINKTLRSYTIKSRRKTSGRSLLSRIRWPRQRTYFYLSLCHLRLWWRASLGCPWYSESVDTTYSPQPVVDHHFRDHLVRLTYYKEVIVVKCLTSTALTSSSLAWMFDVCSVLEVYLRKAVVLDTLMWFYLIWRTPSCSYHSTTQKNVLPPHFLFTATQNSFSPITECSGKTNLK